MKRLSFLKKLREMWLWYVVGVAAIALGVWWFFSPSTTKQETVVIAPKAFVQEVSVSGKVTPAQDVDLGFSQGGKVAGVYVSVGQRVSQGTTLAMVENSDLRASVLQRQAALETQQAKLAALNAGTRPEEIAIAEANVLHSRAALVNALQDAYRAADAAVHNTLDTFIDNGRTNPSMTVSINDNSLKNKVEAERLDAETRLAVWGSVLSLTPSSDLTAALATAQANLTAITGLLSDANAALNRAIPSSISQATIDSYIAAVATARSTVNTSVSALSSASSALDEDNRTLTLKRAGSTAQDIAAQEAQVKAAEADVVAAQAALAKTFISAPFSGTVTVVDAKVGQIVSPNTPEISMISNGAFQIESYIPEVNVALIKIGNKASVTLDAYGDKEFPASVVSIDPASTLRDGVSTYRAVLQFTTQDPLIKSGMTANISIVTLEKANVLSVPQGVVVLRDGKKFVSVKTAAGTSEHEVTTGAVSSLGEVEILSGLSAGDEVILTQP